MISSIRYRSKSAILSTSSTFVPNKKIIVEILALKIATMVTLFALPTLVDQETLCIIFTVLVALDFWVSKTLGRKFLGACWYINTDDQEDEWVYEANLKSPSASAQALFWYSFVLYGILLVVFDVLSLVVGKLSLACAILIGVVANYINFYAFSNIISLRNEGVLQKIHEEMQAQGEGDNIKLPLAYQSKLEVIPEQHSFEHHEGNEIHHLGQA